MIKILITGDYSPMNRVTDFCFDRGPGFKPLWHHGYAVMLKIDDGKVDMELHPYVQNDEVPSILIVKDRSGFDREVRALNEIIADDAKLGKAAESFYMSSTKPYLSIFEPYGCRFLKAAWYRNLLPSFFRRRKQLQALNYMDCESHLDRLRIIMRHILDRSQSGINKK